MKTKGIRIYVEGNEEKEVLFLDILKEIKDGHTFKWSILFLDAWRLAQNGKAHVFDEKINKSKRGLFVTWNELIAFTSDLIDLEEVYIIGCKEENLLQRYATDQEMFETCDISIILIDCEYWEVFSKNKDLINRFISKYNSVELIESNY